MRAGRLLIVVGYCAPLVACVKVDPRSHDRPEIVVFASEEENDEEDKQSDWTEEGCRLRLGGCDGFTICNPRLGACPFCESGMCCVPCPMTKKWEAAIVQENMTFRRLSRFARSIPKVPRSIVEFVQGLDHTKIHTFNFVGRLYLNNKVDDTHQIHYVARKARKWVSRFVEAHFGEHDVFWNQDKKKRAHSEATQSGADLDYYQAMASSNFTLCPGGDNPWSMRFYEAILAGSIPILNDEDLSSPEVYVQCMRELGYKYLRPADELVYSQEWVNDNLRLFMQYQTFMFGDHTPSDPMCIKPFGGKR